MPALPHERDHGQVQGGMARGRGDRADPVLQRRDPLLQDRDRRIRDAAVDMPGALQVEQRAGVLGVFEDIGGGLIDRDRAGARDRVGLLAAVQGQGVELQKLGIGHEISEG